MPDIQLSNSTIRTFKRCRRQWMLHYFYRWNTAPHLVNPSTTAALGTRVHTAMEAYYGYDLDPIEALDVVYQVDIFDHPLHEEVLEKEKGYAVAMVKGYVDWAAEEGIDVDLRVVATERVVSVQLPTAYGIVTLVAKLDQLVNRESDGAILFRDWKTVGTLAKSNHLILDEQFRFYHLLLTLLNPTARVDGGLYLMLLRSKRTARAIPPFYRQDEISYNRNDVESMRLRTVEVAEDIQRTQARLEAGEDHRAVAYPSPGDHCRWACPFTAVCPLMDDGSRWDDALRNNFVQGDPYAYYGSQMIDTVRSVLGKMDTREESGEPVRPQHDPVRPF